MSRLTFTNCPATGNIGDRLITRWSRRARRCARGLGAVVLLRIRDRQSAATRARCGGPADAGTDAIYTDHQGGHELRERNVWFVRAGAAQTAKPVTRGRALVEIFVHKAIAAAVTVIAFTRLIAAQDLGNQVAFDVVSIKLNKSGDLSRGLGMPPGRYMVVNSPIFDSITLAFGVRDEYVVNAPRWVRAELYDIIAAVSTPVPVDQTRAMIRTMLVERMRLKSHTEMREVTSYVLVTARPDHRLGPAMRPAAQDCAPILASARAKNAPPPIPEPGHGVQCGVRSARGSLSAGGVTLDILARVLTNQLGAPVTDQTGLTGSYDVELEWSPASVERPTADVPAVDGKPSLTTAVQEGLGLSLRKSKTSVPYLVIDHIERPTVD